MTDKRNEMGKINNIKAATHEETAQLFFVFEEQEKCVAYVMGGDILSTQDPYHTNDFIIDVFLRVFP